MKKLFTLILAAILLLCAGCKADQPGREDIRRAEEILPLFSFSGHFDWNARYPDTLLNPADTGIFKLYVERLYTMETGEKIGTPEERTAVENYVTYGAKYFDMSKEDIRTRMEKSSSYRRRDDTVLAHDAIGSVISLIFRDLTIENEVYTIDYDITYPDTEWLGQGQLKYTKNEDGSFKFLSQKTLNGMILSGDDHRAEEILPVFAITANLNWDRDNPRALLGRADTNVFKFLTEALYKIYAGEEFENDKGYAPADSYVALGEKYFDISGEDIRTRLENSPAYNGENGTVLMSDGLGCVTSLSFKNLSLKDGVYTIEYDICSPEGEKEGEGQLKYTKNEDGSFRFISQKLTEE